MANESFVVDFLNWFSIVAFMLNNVGSLFSGFNLLLCLFGIFSNFLYNPSLSCIFYLYLYSFIFYNNSTYIIFSSKVWERAEEFYPERFDLEEPVPNETNTDFR